MRTALRLFVERGFDSTTIEQIADAADMSPRNFFRYFATKEQVVFEWRKANDSQLAAAVIARPASEPPLTALREALLSGVSRYQDEEIVRVARLILETPGLRASEQENVKLLERELAEGVAQRLGCDPLRAMEPRILAALALRLFHSSLEYWLEGGCKGRVNEHVKRAFAIVEAAVSTRELKQKL